MVQRIILAFTTHWLLTQLAVGMGRPGLELEDPTALETPEDMPDEQVRELTSKLPALKDLLKRVAGDIEKILKERPEVNGRIEVREEESNP
ncbi:MAG: hypothetical protein GY852_02920, partial [bacterium]|nr:hypothetical protein [bacterium]